MDWKLELVIIPVYDVTRARDFYADQVGFVLDHDITVSEQIRFVQLTPPGSACSIAFGQGVAAPSAAPVKGLQVVVDDVAAARAQLAERGVKVSEIEQLDWGSFVYFDDPDGNAWAIQQLPDRLR